MAFGLADVQDQDHTADGTNPALPGISYTTDTTIIARVGFWFMKPCRISIINHRI